MECRSDGQAVCLFCVVCATDQKHAQQHTTVEREREKEGWLGDIVHSVVSVLCWPCLQRRQCFLNVPASLLTPLSHCSLADHLMNERGVNVIHSCWGGIHMSCSYRYSETIRKKPYSSQPNNILGSFTRFYMYLPQIGLMV